MYRLKNSFLFVICFILTILVVNPPLSHASSLKLITNSPLTKIKPEDKCDSDICKSLLELIKDANRTIDFAIYGMRNQTQILNALNNAKKRGVTIRGIVDMDAKKKNPYSSTGELMRTIKTIKTDYNHDLKFQENKKHQKRFRPYCQRPKGFQGPLQCLGYDLGDKCLTAQHASRDPINSEGDIMHNKFFVIDGRRVWTGSANISDSGIGGYNANMAVVIDSPEVTSWYTREFEQMYQGNYHHSKKANNKSTDLHTIIGDSSKVWVFFSPQGWAMERGVLPLLQNAKKSINITIFFLTHKRVTADLIKAHQRGVKIRIILDATGADNGYTKHELLRAVGIPVKVENWGGKMHMKAAAIDNRYVIAGSMNWTSAGERDNDENTIIIEDTAHAKQFTKFFEELWESIPNRWLQGRPDPESHASRGSCYDRKDNDFDGLVDMCDLGCGSNPPPLPALPPYCIVPKMEGYGLIKGNINRQGKRYYFMPTDKYYDQTKIDERKGERWFCSPVEAEEAGWSKPRSHDRKKESRFLPQMHSQKIISWKETARHYDEFCTVEGTIVDMQNIGKACFLNFHPDWKNHFTAVIFANRFSQFPADPEQYYRGKKVRVTGRIEKNKKYKKPQIKLESSDQIKIIN